MSETTAGLTALYSRIPRRHSVENVAEIKSTITEYEAVLIAIEAINPYYEKLVPQFFDEVEEVKFPIKKSTDNKASKKTKDIFFDEAADAFKDSIQKLIEEFDNGKKS